MLICIEGLVAQSYDLVNLHQAQLPIHKLPAGERQSPDALRSARQAWDWLVLTGPYDLLAELWAVVTAMQATGG